MTSAAQRLAEDAKESMKSTTEFFGEPLKADNAGRIFQLVADFLVTFNRVQDDMKKAAELEAAKKRREEAALLRKSASLAAKMDEAGVDGGEDAPGRRGQTQKRAPPPQPMRGLDIIDAMHNELKSKAPRMDAEESPASKLARMEQLGFTSTSQLLEHDEKQRKRNQPPSPRGAYLASLSEGTPKNAGRGAGNDAVGGGLTRASPKLTVRTKVSVASANAAAETSVAVVVARQVAEFGAIGGSRRAAEAPGKLERGETLAHVENPEVVGGFEVAVCGREPGHQRTRGVGFRRAIVTRFDVDARRSAAPATTPTAGVDRDGRGTSALRHRARMRPQDPRLLLRHLLLVSSGWERGLLLRRRGCAPRGATAASSATSSWSHRDGSGASSSAAACASLRHGPPPPPPPSSLVSSGWERGSPPPPRPRARRLLPRDRRRLLRHLLPVSSGWERPQRLHRLPAGPSAPPPPRPPPPGLIGIGASRAASPGAAEAACSAEIRAAARSRGHRRGDDAT